MLWGPKFGMLRAAPSGPALLADFDYTAPVAQEFPTTATALATLLGDNSILASHIFPIQDASTPLVDSVGAGSLVVASGLVGQGAPGIYDGSSYTSRLAYEILASSNKAQNTGDVTLFDQTLGSFAIIGVYRARSSAGNGAIVGKRNATAGWEVGATSTTGLRLRLKDTSGVEKSAIQSSSNVKDFAHRAFAVVINRTTNLAWIITKDQAVSVDISALGSLTTTAPLAIGQQDGYVSGASGVQMEYLVLFEGALAELITQTTLGNFFKHAKDPGVAASKTALTITSRPSLISHEVAPGKIAHFSGGTTLDTCQLPITHSPAFDGGAGGLGLYCNSDVVNLVENNRGIAGATGATTNTANFADASDGFRAAVKSVANSSPDFFGRTMDVVAETEYTGSIYIKEETVAVVGRVFAYDLTNGAEIAGSSVAYTADGTWEQRIKTTFTTPAGCISVSLRAEITNNGESILHDFWQLQLGDGAGAIINTNGAAAALVYCNYAAVASAGVLTKAATGEIEYVYSIPAPSNNQWAVTCSNGGNNNLRAMLFNPNPQARVFNSSGGVEADINSGSQDTEAESTSVLSWDDSGGLGGGKDAILTFNGGSSVDDVGSFTSTEMLTKVQIGNWETPSSAFAVDGFISRVRIWNRERP